MQFFKYFAVTVVILALVIPTECGWLRKTIKKVGRSIKKVVKKAGSALKKVKCKVTYGVLCPAAVAGAGAVVGAGTSGVGTALVATGVALGKNYCDVKRNKCKRSVNMNETEILLPFSDEMSDYDFNGDKRITYTEFVWAVVTSVPLRDPDQLMEPFAFADFNGDGELDSQEFEGAPFLFAHASMEPQSATAA